MDVIQLVGAFAGLAAFLGLAVLALLYFSQARDVRRLRERAAFLPEGYEAPAEGAEEALEPVPAAAATAERGDPVAVARQAEMARAAAERRMRFQRRRTEGGELAPRGRGGPDLRSVLVIGAGIVILAVGVVFGGSRILGGEEAPETGGGQDQEQRQGPAPSDITVAVLNGTAVQGLAAQVAAQVSSDGFQLGPVTNSETPVEATVVMYDRGSNAEGNRVAAELQIGRVEEMTGEIRAIADGAPVVVIVGEDRATG